MALEPFLAMTAAEMRNISVFPSKIAWMACHFSPYGLGLSNLPGQLPVGSLLILDDFTPPAGQDPVLVTEQLSLCVESFQCSGILLDFQRAGYEETYALAKHLTASLPCPVAVSELYGKELDCPVFLPPVPLSMAPEAYFAPWKGREIWLEAGLDAEMITLTEQGPTWASLPFPDLDQKGFAEETLHCHYTVSVTERSARFTLWRTWEDFQKVLETAEGYGIATFVGLYQQLSRIGSDSTPGP